MPSVYTETTEIVVERAKLLRFAERGGDFDAVFGEIQRRIFSLANGRTGMRERKAEGIG